MLASLPLFKRDLNHNELITVSQPRAHVSETFRVLRTGVQFASLDKKNVSIMVTSGTPEEGKSTVSANLAVVLAQAGARVLLIDTDLRRPRQHAIFNLPNDRGLTSYLLEAKVDDSIKNIWNLLSAYIQKSDVPDLSILTSGPLPPNPSELLGSTKMQMTFAALVGEFDYLVFDTTPVLAVTDALVMSTQVDNIILVTRSGQTRRNQLQQVKERLSKMKGNVIGVVLNRWSTEQGNDYYYYNYQTVPATDHEAPVNSKQKRFITPPWRTRSKEKETTATIKKPG
ncbi:MAG: CpsD/CapB family tyrosine-protein kinase [Chloroflexi bacterium]|nr:CpsD/CapB family tyrosine-protein kinase [Chloroflexota bacterium]